MITKVEFTNLRALKKAILPLGRITLIVGANGSGKSTALEGIRLLSGRATCSFADYVTRDSGSRETQEVVVKAEWGAALTGNHTTAQLTPGYFRRDTPGPKNTERMLHGLLNTIRVFAFDVRELKADTRLTPGIELMEHGQHLAGILDRLRDEVPERFEGLNDELGRWLPEFDRVLFETPGEGARRFLLRQTEGGAKIPATSLSDGTVLALAMLAIAYSPQPPFVVGFEEPDSGLHPRLLRDVRDALYRLAHPEDFDDSRPPVQVVATTHSPYFLNLFRDHPEEIVIAEKTDEGAEFHRLIDLPNVEEILRDGDLGAVWYTGILGGVPAR
jgi:predicted ATPase